MQLLVCRVPVVAAIAFLVFAPSLSAQLDAPADVEKQLHDWQAEAAALDELADIKRDELAELVQRRESLDALIQAARSATGDPGAPSHASIALPPIGAPWLRHTIDSGLRRSEGIRLGDVNRDGLPDLAVGWESEELTRIYLNPGPKRATLPWSAVTIGSTPSVEDALLVDLDGDGALDIVASLEKGAERMAVFWSTTDTAKIFDSGTWIQDELTQVRGVSQWMFAAPIHLSPGAPLSLVIGGKNYNSDASAVLGLLIAPTENPRELSDWQWRPLAQVSWVMSIETSDVDGDGFEDILYSDKHGPMAGVHWLKNPGGDRNREWPRTALTGASVTSANFLTRADLDRDGLEDILAVVEYQREPGAPNHAHRRVLFLRRLDASATRWETFPILLPPGIGQAKGIAVADIDLDGKLDIVLSSTGAYGELIGASWLQQGDSPYLPVWTAHNIAGPTGIKYDLIYAIDLDADGDLDVLANDEKEDRYGLGVFWYENPAISAPSPAAPSMANK